MTKALISIDYSYDFVADDGKLTAGKPAQAIEDRIAQITQEAYDNGDYIFVAMDRHDEGDTFHPETKLFPPHNIAGTSGRELYGKLASVYDAIKDDHRVFWMDKRHYSAFSGTDLDIRGVRVGSYSFFIIVIMERGLRVGICPTLNFLSKIIGYSISFP